LDQPPFPTRRHSDLMTVYILRRLMQSALVMVAMAVIVFFGIHTVGNPVDLFISPDMDQADIEQVVRSLGLDRPIWEQFWYFVKGDRKSTRLNSSHVK